MCEGLPIRRPDHPPGSHYCSRCFWNTDRAAWIRITIREFGTVPESLRLKAFRFCQGLTAFVPVAARTHRWLWAGIRDTHFVGDPEIASELIETGIFVGYQTCAAGETACAEWWWRSYVERAQITARVKVAV